ncbi:MAG: RBBP9/YdeN family alpha/beta hydrolase [Patescibacteria group bacterium]
MQEVILVHGWLSGPRHHWFPWLKRSLAKHGYAVTALRMPNPIYPSKDKWVAKLKQVLNGKDPSHTILIGHSLGTPTILYALQEHDGPKFAHVVLVGGFARKIPHLNLVCKGYNMGFDLEAIKCKACHWTIIHGDNDPLVPFGEGEWLAKQLGTQVIIENNKGHLTQYRGVFKLESILNSIAANQPLSSKLKEALKPALRELIKLESALREILKLDKRA